MYVVISMIILDICSNPYTLKVFKIVRIVIKIIRIVVPIMLIVSVMIDFMKEITNKTNDFSSIGNLVFKKILAAVLVFLIPTIISIISTSTGLNTDSYMSCLNNSTNENIEKYQVEYAKRLMNNAKKNFNNSEYNIVKAEVIKIKDDSIRKTMIDELDKYKKDFEEERAKKEKEESAKYAAPGHAVPSNASANKKINEYVQKAYDIANDNSHGYCNFDGCSQGNMFNPDVDCGTFVSFSLQHAGVIPSGVFMNPNDPNVAISNIGGYGFKMYPFNVSELQYGDILVRYGHTEIFVGNNQSIGAHSSHGNLQPGDQNGDEVSVVGLDHNWTNFLRYYGN